MTDERPDPDLILQSVMRDASLSRRGRLKIFLGMAPGVGKTYAMLAAARRRFEAGLQVLIGYVETHGRPETEALAEGLPTLPRLEVAYHGATLEDFDLDTALRRQPRLLLVDELAHTNAPGLRHGKRYLDVLELLEAGIDVWTTLNVQHIESRVEAVRQITGVHVREAVPDSLLDMADEIELIDLPPDDLQTRLVEGKVYMGAVAATAADNFFRTGNLTALREIAFRISAEYTEKRLREYMHARRIPGPWKSGHRLLVAVGPSPHATTLLRWTRSLAAALEAPWIAVHVETAAALPDDARARAARALDLARELGAEVIVTQDEDVVAALLRVARLYNVTQIVTGKSDAPRHMGRFGSESLTARLIRESGDIDVHAVRVDDGAERETPATARGGAAVRWRDYGLSVLVTLGVLLVCLGVEHLIGYWTVALILLTNTFALATRLGRGPLFISATLSALLWDFLFIPPRFTFFIGRPEDVVMFVLYFVVALVTGGLTSRIRAQEQAARTRESRIGALNAFLRESVAADGLEALAAGAEAHLRAQCHADVCVFLPDPRGDAAPVTAHPAHPDERERAVASWVLRNGRPAGQGTQTLSSSAWLFLPLHTQGRTLGVVGVRTHRSVAGLQPDERSFLDAVCGQLAQTLERRALDALARSAEMLQESHRLQKTLLNSVSHELRTPLATLAGAASALADPAGAQDPAERAHWASEMLAATERLNRVVENLLDMSRLESGMLTPRIEWVSVEEVVGIVLRKLRPMLAHRVLALDIPEHLPLVRADARLLEQALANVLHNAVAHTHDGTTIALIAHADGASLAIDVRDNGPGFAPDALLHAFEKFNHAPGSQGGGLGLGLAITRGLIEALGGRVDASNHAEGGAVVTMRLPVPEQPRMPEEG